PIFHPRPAQPIHTSPTISSTIPTAFQGRSRTQPTNAIQLIIRPRWWKCHQLVTIRSCEHFQACRSGTDIAHPANAPYQGAQLIRCFSGCLPARGSTHHPPPHISPHARLSHAQTPAPHLTQAHKQRPSLTSCAPTADSSPPSCRIC